MKRRIFVTSLLVVAMLIMVIGGYSAKEKTKISFLTLDAINFRGALEQFISEFNKANDDVEIVPNFSSSPDQQVLTGLQTGTEPDITFIWNTALTTAIHQGKLASMPASFLAKAKKNLYADSMLPLTYKNKVYGVPYNYFPSFSMIIYNTDLWKAAGIDPTTAKTWDEFMTMCQKLTKRDAAGNLTQVGFSAQRNMHTYFMAFLLQLGGKPFNTNGSVAFDNALGRKAVQTYADIYSKWKVDDPAFGMTTEEFKKGRVAASIIGPWYGSILTKDSPNIHYAYFQQPKIGSNPTYWPLTEVWMHGVSKRNQNNQAVWRFLDFLLQPEISARWAAFAGENSPVKATTNSDLVKNSKDLAPYAKIMDLGKAKGIAEWLNMDIITSMQKMLERVIRGTATVDESLKQCAQEVNKVTSQLAR